MPHATGRSLRMRPLLLIAHRYLGLTIALFLLVAGATGALLAFYYEIDQALNPRLFKIPPSTAPSLQLQEVVSIVTRAYPESRIRVVSLKRDFDQSLRVSLTPRIDPATGKPYPQKVSDIYLNPHTGEILGERNRDAFKFDRLHIMPFIYKLHYSLHLPGRWGEWLFGIAAMLWMTGTLIGFYLTLPAGRHGKQSGATSLQKPRRSWLGRWRPAWKIKSGASATRLNFDLHRAGGLWLSGVMLIVAMSGVALTLGNEVFRPVVGWFGNITQDRLEVRTDPEALPHITYDRAISLAIAVLPAQMRGMRPVSVRHLPAQRTYAVFFAYPGFREEAFNVGLERLYIDSSTGHLISHVSYLNGTAADQFLGMQFSLHTGQMLGLPGRVLIGLSGIVIVALVLTGIAIWLRKMKPR
jgi:uncharacterized iron-regulated membrane protein